MSKKHTHRYRRVNIGRNGKEYWVMRCIKDSCTHYTPMNSKLSAPMLKGNVAECNRCGDEFALNKRALRMELPCCDACVKRKNKTEIEKAADFWKELEKEVGITK